MLCQFLLYSKVNQLYVYTYPLFFQILFPYRSLQSIEWSSELTPLEDTHPIYSPDTRGHISWNFQLQSVRERGSEWAYSLASAGSPVFLTFLKAENFIFIIAKVNTNKQKEKDPKIPEITTISLLPCIVFRFSL